MSEMEKLHIEAHANSKPTWVRCMPLEWERWNLTSAEWRTAARRRLHVDVVPVERVCPFCKWHRCDTKGNHATACGGGSSRLLRHNSVRDVLARAIRDIGCIVDFEHGGGLRDGRRPGDIIVYNWKQDKHLLIDVAITNPLCPSRAHLLEEYGSGGAAADYEKHKRERYKDLDFSKYIFIPFVLETCAGMGVAAEALCQELGDRWRKRLCREPDQYRNDKTEYNFMTKLLYSISIVVQRANSRMILEREPLPTTLIMEKISQCKVAIEEEQRWALDTIKVEPRKNSKYSQDQDQGAPTNLEVKSSLIVKEGDKKEHVMAKKTLKGQNVSTHLISDIPLSIPSNKRCVNESQNAAYQDDVNMCEPIEHAASRNWPVTSPSSTDPLNSLKVKEGEKREHIMAKRTLNGQNVSTHHTSYSYFPGQYSTDKSCGVLR